MTDTAKETPIAFVVATVHFPLYERDHHQLLHSWDGFEYSEPTFGRRPCWTVEARIVSPEELNP